MKGQTDRREITVLSVVPDERLGGPQQRVLQVARNLKEAGIKTIVVMPRGDKTFARILNDGDIAHFQLRSFRRLPNPSNLPDIIVWFLYFFPCVFTVMRLIWKHKVDIVHVNGALNVQVSLAAKLSRAKLVWHLNDVRNPKLLKPILFPLLYFLPDRVATASEVVHRNYFGEGKNSANNATTLYPPVDTVKFHPGYNVEGVRNELRLKEHDKIVGTVGNINPFKGYEYFFSAARFVKEAFPEVKFLVVGKRLETQEKYWQRIHALIVDLEIEDNIILAGYRADIPQIMNVMDIFVLASVLEAAPIVVLEAMACARPVVATGVGGVPELVIDGETGILVPPKQPEAIAKAVLYLLNNPKKAGEMGLKGRQRVTDHFNLAMCAQRHEEIYNTVL
jgi:glycosyltransferase involved in cell wall biosynthesis